MTEQQWRELAVLYRQALDEILQRPEMQELWARGDRGDVHRFLRSHISDSVSVS